MKSFFAAFAAVLCIGASTLYLDDQRRADRVEEECARQQAVIDGVHAISDALITATADTPRTPDEAADRREAIAAFESDLDVRLRPLAPGEDCS